MDWCFPPEYSELTEVFQYKVNEEHEADLAPG